MVESALVSLALAFALVVAACGSNGDEAAGPVDGLPDEAAASPSSESTTSTSTSTTSTTSPSTNDTTTPEETGGSSVTIVRFENDEHLQDTIDIELVEQKMVEAVEAEDNNWLSCEMAPEDCDFDRDVLPMVSLTRETFLRGILDKYLGFEGSRYRHGPDDVRVLIDVRVNNSTPVVGDVRVCEIDSGQVYIPASGDQPEEILDDDVSAVIHRYFVNQGEDGVLRVTARATDQIAMGDVTACDEYRR